MIFKRLFAKKKWQSTKISDRISAVSELDRLNGEQKSILHELAFNDAEKSVRRAALEKLNDFSLFWQAAKKDPNEDVSRFALKHIRDALVAPQSEIIEQKEKVTFIKECSNAKFIDEIKFLLPSEDLVEVALQRLDKQDLYIEALLQGRLSAETATAVVESVNDLQTLKKLQKKLSGQSQIKITNKISEVEQHTIALSQAEKKSRLVLAQLNALKDKQDFEEISLQYQKLNQDWQAQLPLVNELDKHVSNELNAKYDAINSSLKDKLSFLEVAHLEQKEQLEQLEQQKQLTAEIESELTQFENELNDLVSEGGEIKLGMTETLAVLADKIDSANLTDNENNKLSQRIDKLQRGFIDLPKIKLLQKEAIDTIEKIESIDLPSSLETLNTIKPTFKELKKSWSELEQSISISHAVTERYNIASAALDKSIKKLEAEQNKRFSSFKRKQSELMQLITDGRFREAFGLFNKLQKWHGELNVYQQTQIEKQWTDSNVQIEQLRDLEQSIAEPKRQELLEQIEKLAKQPLVDASEQAHRVKVLRSDWLSLGRIDREDPLNLQFNEFSEQAFAVCRAFYSELEQEREQAYQAKLLVLEQLETLANNLANEEVSSWKEVELLNGKLTKHWFDIGLVDKSKVSEINERFTVASKSIKAKIIEQQKINQADKQALLDKAKQISDSDTPLPDKANKLKQLQSDWKKIGFCGRKVDDKLWGEFRLVNNAVFDALGELRNANRTRSTEIKNDLITQLNAFTEQLKSLTQNSEAKALGQQVKELVISKSELEKSDYERVLKVKNTLLEKVEETEQSLRKNMRLNQYVMLFNALEDLASGKTIDTSVLKPSWSNALNANSKVDRLEATLKMEIIAELESPESELPQRQAVQMSMMTEKLESGTSYSKDELLEDWLSAGAISSDDVALISRVRQVFSI